MKANIKSITKAVSITCAAIMLLTTLSGCGADKKTTAENEPIAAEEVWEKWENEKERVPLNELPEDIAAPDETAIVKVNDNTSLVSNELTVSFKYGVSDDDIMKFLEEFDAVAVSHQEALGEYQIRFNDSGNEFLEEIKDRVAADSRVEAVYYSAISEADTSKAPNKEG